MDDDELNWAINDIEIEREEVLAQLVDLNCILNKLKKIRNIEDFKI